VIHLPNENRNNRSIGPNKNVFTVIVMELKSSGALVEMPNGEMGWIPAFEIDANFKEHQDFRNIGKEYLNKKLSVIRIEDHHGQTNIVSHIRVNQDPWDEVLTWKENTVLTMEISTSNELKVIGIIKPGIRGEIKTDSLKGLLPNSWGDFARPLIGDEVAGHFHANAVNYSSRILTLDMVGYIKSLNTVSKLLVPSPTEFEVGSSSYQINTPSENDLIRSRFKSIVLKNIHYILLVDDDDSFRNSLKSFLEEEKHCEVIDCKSETDAIEKIKGRKTDFHLAIIDLQLDNKNGAFQGLTVARQLQNEQFNCPVVITTGVDPYRTDPRLEKTDLKVNLFVSKPFGFEALYLSLAAICNERISLLELLPGGEVAVENQPKQSDLQKIAKELRQKVNAEAIVLFVVDLISYTINFEVRADPEKLFLLLKPQIERSPIRDVAIDREIVFTTNAKSPTYFAKHKYLQEAYGYHSCIGVPVQLSANSSAAYALFAFHRNVHAFNENDKSILQEYSEKFSYLIRIDRLEQELRQVKPFEIMGKVYGSMAHDLSSALSIDFLLNELKEAPNKNELIQKLYVKNSRANDIVKTFRSMARGVRDDVSEFPIYDELADTVYRFRQEAQRYNIKSISLHQYKESPFLVIMRKSGFTQVIYNLLLNAAQQIGRIYKIHNESGEIIIDFSIKTGPIVDRAVILIHDNGPGIHKRDFDRIFEMHFTTKKEGCGMGLDICRSIVNEVNLNNQRGSLQVLRSILLVGTTFELSLPVRRL